MHFFTGIQETQDLCQKWRDKVESIAFVPTMGCLHEGHLSLVEKAKSLAQHVVVSIFVNPLQFDDVNDLAKYPHTLEDDRLKLEELGIDLLFAPDVDAFYPEGEHAVKQTDLGQITAILEGAQRPGHFAGVATVVERLFGLIQPNIAIFGEKDFQQLMVIQKLVKEFSLDIEIVGMPIFREEDGLAMSSRNLRLTEAEREKAAEIYQQLALLRKEILAGANNFAVLEQLAIENLIKAGFEPEYVVIRETSTLLPPVNHSDDKVILIAAKLGETRLIDNIRV
ncbi:MAG: pantoate--beta-alanine ligase [Gammaproteobacteria bacterium]|nr:pantoate--beta-alanine ligase [Gammaproteobacteria bacterium]MCW8987671.1 pantoate--beta-alanine ligase [Gammaproteobacteria bacterium]MCW9031426.1 pantoate--beta-alanine ligase [Gammaproteobacteria bacterium]